jgi:hypothetical protein
MLIADLIIAAFVAYKGSQAMQQDSTNRSRQRHRPHLPLTAQPPAPATGGS